MIDKLYPGKFRFHCDEGAFDYVYSIDDLADLAGKKYHGKRNHIYRFEEAYPRCSVQKLCDDNAVLVREMLCEWYDQKMQENPNSDFHMERAALEKALRDYKALGMEGIVLINETRVLAFSLGNRLSEDTFDVNFEKARADASGAYPMINREFSRHIRNEYPEVKFLNREEDMGIDGLRKAKQSYHPHHLVKKYWACLLDDEYEY